LGWLNLSRSPTLPPPVTVKHPSGQIPDDEPKHRIDGYRGKDTEKRKVLRRQWKTPWMSTTGLLLEIDNTSRMLSAR